MDKNNLGFLLWFMAISTIALVVVQAYWLSEQYEQSRQTLYRAAQNSLLAVNQEIRKAQTFVSNVEDQQSFDFHHWAPDSSRVFVFASNVGAQVIEADTVLQQTRRDQALKLATEALGNPSPKEGIIETVLLRTIQQCSDCSVSYVSTELFSIAPLLEKALVQNGISMPFLAGLQSQGTKQFQEFYGSASVDSIKLASSPLVLSLSGDHEALYLLFPQEQNWIIKQLWVQLLISFVLILIIFGSFFYAWRMLSRQKRLSEMKNDFINNMTHEFKTPIATIAFAVANINNKEVINHPNKINEFTRVINTENQRLNAHVEKVLRAALIDQEVLPVSMEEVLLYPLMDNLVNNFKLRIEEKGGYLKSDLLAVKDTEWHIDPLHLANVINNLLDNAVKYAGDKPPEVQLSAAITADSLEIVVNDKGIGIPQNQLATVFEKFYRGQTGNVHNTKGFGLGLSYVQHVVQKMGGEISVKSNVSAGTTFTIIFDGQ